MFTIFCLQVLTIAAWANGTLMDKPEKIPGVTFITKDATVEVLYSSSELCSTKIEIRNSSGQVVFSEIVRTRNGFSRPYNLSGLPPGVYKVIVSNDRESGSEKVIVRKKHRQASTVVTSAG